LLGAAELMFRF